MRVDALEGAGVIKGTLGLVCTPGAPPALGELGSRQLCPSGISACLGGGLRVQGQDTGSSPDCASRSPVVSSVKGGEGPCLTVNIHIERLPPGLTKLTSSNVKIQIKE